jgi:hypothetical protein
MEVILPHILVLIHMKGLCKAGQCQISSFYGIERGLHLLLDSTGISIRGWKSMAWMANGDKDLHLSTFKWIGACNLFKKRGVGAKLPLHDHESGWEPLLVSSSIIVFLREIGWNIWGFTFLGFNMNMFQPSSDICLSLSLSQYIQVIYVHKWYMHTICYNMFIYII